MNRNLKLLLIVLCSIVFIHLLMATNSSYAVDGLNLNKDGYKQYLTTLNTQYRQEAIAETKTVYFGSLPHWSMNIVYLAYFIVSINILNKAIPKR